MSVKKNFFYNTVLNVLNIIFPIITVPYISRVLGVEGVGIINFSITYVSYFILFANLGLSIYGVREIAKYKTRTQLLSCTFSELFFLNVVSTFIVSVIFMITVFKVPTLSENYVIFLIVGIPLFLTPLSIDWYFSGLEKFKLITVRSLIIKVIGIASLFLFVKENDDILEYVLIYVFTVLANYLWNIFYALKTGLVIRLKNINWKRHVRPLFILFSSVVAISIFILLDTLMLGFMSDYKEVGIYTSAIKIVKLIIPVFSALGVVLLPRLVFNQQGEEVEKNQLLLQKSYDFTTFFSVPSMVGLFLISQWFVPLFFGVGFEKVIPSMQVLSMLILIIGLNNFFGMQILVGLGKDSKFLIAVVAAALSNITLNLVLIPYKGALGASIASVIAESIQLLVNIYMVKRYTNIVLRWYSLFAAFICSLALTVFYVVIRCGISNPFYSLVLFVMGGGLLYVLMQYYAFKNETIVYMLSKMKFVGK